MDPLYSLVYVSSARNIFSKSELETLLLEVRTRNREQGITGILLHHAGNFIQLLEGPRTALMSTYARIKASTRHADILELVNEEVQEREFTEWSMAFSQASAPEFLALRDASWRGANLQGERKLSPGKELLSHYWRNMR